MFRMKNTEEMCLNCDVSSEAIVMIGHALSGTFPSILYKAQ